MELFNSNNLVFFIGFILPGVICLKVYTLLCRTQSTDFNKKILDSLTYSCLIYGLHFPIIYLVEHLNLKNTYKILYAIFYYYVMVISPILLSILWHKIRKYNFFQRFVSHPTPLPWDYVFKKRTICWVIVELNDGTKIYGRYGSNSFVSSFPYNPQIYLDECWKPNLEGGFDRKHHNSAGIIIMSSDIKTIEFFEDMENYNQ